ncbi:MAG: acyltransferase, partial [Deltaproteobacteria bacterium]|nr:acyltransferase [Deltaproteobacteria bacterium]
GARAVIGAGAAVVDDIAPGAIAVGVPARVSGTLSDRRRDP